jgi:hypothetical protein
MVGQANAGTGRVAHRSFIVPGSFVQAGPVGGVYWARRGFRLLVVQLVPLEGHTQPVSESRKSPTLEGDRRRWTVA